MSVSPTCSDIVQACVTIDNSVTLSDCIDDVTLRTAPVPLLMFLHVIISVYVHVDNQLGRRSPMQQHEYMYMYHALCTFRILPKI